MSKNNLTDFYTRISGDKSVKDTLRNQSIQIFKTYSEVNISNLNVS